MSLDNSIVVVLAGGHGERLSYLHSLLEHSAPARIIISGGTATWPEALPLLEHPAPGTSAELFWPDPATTQGEAHHLGILLSSTTSKVTVITSDYHVRRAGRWLAHRGLTNVKLHGVPTPALSWDLSLIHISEPTRPY